MRLRWYRAAGDRFQTGRHAGGRLFTLSQCISQRDSVTVAAGEQQARVGLLGMLHDVLETTIPEHVLRNGLGPNLVGPEGWVALYTQQQAQLVQDASGQRLGIGIDEVRVARASQEQGQQDMSARRPPG